MEDRDVKGPPLALLLLKEGRAQKAENYQLGLAKPCT